MTDPIAQLNAALLDRYVIDRELGRGGMATVYLARDLKHERFVALKTLRPEIAAALGPERFLREIKLAARLQHPNILAVYDSGDAGGVLYFVMPFVEGESLRDRLDREPQLPLEDAVRLTQEVADALAYAHGHDVVQDQYVSLGRLDPGRPSVFPSPAAYSVTSWRATSSNGCARPSAPATP